MMQIPPSDTNHFLGHGVRVLQSHYAEGGAESHVALLLEAFDLPHGALVLDAGCGVGEVSRLMREQRPDLSFILLNTDTHQHALCPKADGLTPVMGDFHATGLVGASVDAVMFCFALGHGNLDRALNEAARVLKPGGAVLVYDIHTDDADTQAVHRGLNYSLRTSDEVSAAAQRQGMKVDSISHPVTSSAHMANVVSEQAFSAAFGKVRPYLLRCSKQAEDSRIHSAFGRHQKIALQFSGGKDSLACLYLLRDYWDRLTVYHTNTGDAFPETREIVERVKSEIPNFVEIQGRTHQVHETFGIPSDIVPASSNRLGFDMGVHKNPLIVDRYTCCYLSIMAPMNERMVADGITLIIRGQKTADTYKPEIRSGAEINGVEFLYPIEEWTQDTVLQFLRDAQVPVSRFYDTLNSMPDCMSCSAWWDDGRGEYLQRYHPAAHHLYQQRLNAIADAVDRHAGHFSRELGEPK